MPNPRFLDKEGNPTVELLLKIERAKKVYLGNLEKFCKENFISSQDFKQIEKVYLIGSHATENDWDNERSDVDFKLVVPKVLPMNLLDYKRKILDPSLKQETEEKRKWIDLYFVHSDYQVLPPRFDLTEYWYKIKI
ncbi:MAG: hypothetical protein QXG18_00740 [Candidatus Pacearchaeota archaeon]